MSELTRERIEELAERSKDDRAMIVGSEIRQLCAMALRGLEAPSATEPIRLGGQEFWWLIEAPNYGRPMYYTADPTDNGGWTSKSEYAARFPNRNAADHIIVQMRLWDHKPIGFQKPEPKEHGFIYVEPK